MIGYILCSRATDDALTGLGVWRIEQEAKDAATDGRYVLIPITEGEKYPNILSINMPGAIQFEVSGTATRLDALENQAADFETDITTLQNQMSNAAPRLTGAEAAIDDLQARVTVLENP